jgi:hypothetical protein
MYQIMMDGISGKLGWLIVDNDHVPNNDDMPINIMLNHIGSLDND